MINSDYLKNLNSAQKEAVLYLEGPLLIVAGAGSGKTKVLTSRIAHIIKKNLLLTINFFKLVTFNLFKFLFNRLSIELMIFFKILTK